VLSTLVLVVDDDPSFRKAVSRLLRAAGYEVASYGSAQQLIEQLPQDDRPSCILLDVQIPSLSGPELQNRLSAAGSLVPIVFLTGHGDIPTSVQAIKAGAEDFLTKPVSKEVLLDAIERAVARYSVVRAQHDQLDALHALIAKLTPRERQVLAMVVRGRPNKQIADELGMVERTVKAHRRRVMEKTKVKNLPELVSIAERLGMIGAPPGGNTFDAISQQGRRPTE
jgi:RNA polymerase sigma factor (sigma-70 family)